MLKYRGSLGSEMRTDFDSINAIEGVHRNSNAASDLGSNIYIEIQPEKVPLFEVISQAPLFATPELQSDASLC